MSFYDMDRKLNDAIVFRDWTYVNNPLLDNKKSRNIGKITFEFFTKVTLPDDTETEMWVFNVKSFGNIGLKGYIHTSKIYLLLVTTKLVISRRNSELN